MLSQRPEAQKKAGDQDKGTSSSFASDQLRGGIIILHQSIMKRLKAVQPWDTFDAQLEIS